MKNAYPNRLLATLVYGKFCFRLEYDDTSGMNAWTWHLSLFRCKYDYPTIFEAIDKAKFIRTFLSLDHESSHFSSIKLQNLLSKLQFFTSAFFISLSYYRATCLNQQVETSTVCESLSHSNQDFTRNSMCSLQFANIDIVKLSLSYLIAKKHVEAYKLASS